ncbi:MAG: hypothetical protein IIX61_01110 [Loktanella sp.]|nr:hypothetical protein [Loktanella sp.]
MIKFINAQTGGEMWVHESRITEYEAMGHKIAPRPIPEKKKPPVKKSPKKQG